MALSATAFGQEADNASAETVVVTGSRIISDAANSPTPLTVVTAQQLTATTPTQLPNALNKLPIFVGTTSNRTTLNAGANAAGATLNLRNFGANRTLVLLDGRRVPASNTDGTVNINTLPQALVRRVDVVTGGASAVYGSDAVTGVVNFVLNDHFNGFKIDTNAGISNYEDGATYNLSLAGGSDLFGGRAHLEGDVRVFHQDSILNRARPTGTQNWELSGTGTAANPYTNTANATLSTYAFGGRISCAGCTANGEQFVTDGTLGRFNVGTPTGTGGMSQGGDGTYATIKDLLAMEADEEAFGRFSYNINDETTAFVQVSLTQEFDKASYQNQYIQTANAPNTFFANNAYLSAASQAALAGAATGKFQLFSYINNQGIYGGFDTLALENVDNITAGVDGTLFGKYDWSVYYTHGQDRQKVSDPNNMNLQRLWAAEDAVATPGGSIACHVSTTSYANLYPGCVPVNPFGPTSMTAGQWHYFNQQTYYVQTNQIDDAGGSVSGDLFDDWAGTIKAALSAEARWNSLTIDSNANPAATVNCTGLRLCNTLTTLWQASTVANMPTATENVWEVAGEVNVPLIKDVPFVQDFSADLAGRHTDYSVTGSAETWKIGFDYHVNSVVRFRGTTSVDIRAPTLSDLFSPAQFSSGGFNDLHTNITANAKVQTAGNPNLVPEVSRTYTGGVVFTPDFVPNLTFSVDYYNINMKNAIGAVTGRDVPEQLLCEQSNGVSPFCALVVRPLPFADHSPANFPTYAISESLNAAFQKTEGWDIELNYGFGLGDVWDDAPGTVNLRMIANIRPVLESQPYPGAPLNFAPSGSTASSKGRVTSFLTYNVGSWGFNLEDRWLSGFPRAVVFGQVYVDPRTNSVNTQDITIDKKFQVDGRTLDGYFSIQNVGAVLPPINMTVNQTVPGAFFQGVSGTNSASYDPVGRFFTLGLRAAF